MKLNEYVINIPTGRCILAVSGGVDSMVLMDLMANQIRDIDKAEIIVGHFNHGIRPDSDMDEKLVVATAAKYGLKAEVGHGGLGAKASENTARDARYDFLYGLKKKYNAKCIITAHHQDDLIETAILNLMRGTGRYGLSSIKHNTNVIRPLLNVPKSEILKFAKANKLAWLEDKTNEDQTILRNYVRREIVPRLSSDARKDLLDNIEAVARKRDELNGLIAALSASVTQSGKINRQSFIELPVEIEKELVSYWLRRQGVKDFDKKTVERLTIALKTAKAGSKHDVMRSAVLVVENKYAYLK